MTRKSFRQRHLLICSGLLGAVVAALVSIGCQSVPVSERRQLLLVSEAEENQLGLTAYQEVLKSEPVTSNETAADIVRRVGQRIAAVADRPDFDWEFNVIEAETQNAFCLPGGKVAVYTGILPICQNEAGLAVVMSHEIGHAIARHGGERMTHQMVQNKVKDGVAFLMRDRKETTQKIVLTAYGAGAQYGAILPYSRKHELEADQIGIMMMARAGYDPSEAPAFWERFSGQKDGAAPMEFLSTHPSDARRSFALRDALPEAMEIYDAAAEKIGTGQSLDGLTGAEAAKVDGKDI
ncbi:MAG: M48 family metallopeptidase [Fuerstiella sp.]|nr:M48 family metallopeptidase [Fuerstiella sp.]